jgi:hypothetical protein
MYTNFMRNSLHVNDYIHGNDLKLSGISGKFDVKIFIFWDITPCSKLKNQLTFQRKMLYPSSRLKNKASKKPA